MKKILIILGHPRKKSYCLSLAESYISGAKSSGSKVKFIEVNKLKFDSNFKEEYKGKQKLEEDLKKSQKDILWANHIVFIYPLWWGFMPALLKGFIDRTFESGFAAKYSKLGIPIGLLKEKSARIIITMDAPPFWYNLIYGNHGLKVLKKCILKFCGFKPIKITKMGPVYKSTDKKRKQWLNKIYKLGKKD